MNATPLSSSELKVVQTLTTGLSEEAVGLQLGIPHKIVRRRISGAKAKVGARSLCQLIARCYELRILTIPNQ